MADDVERLMTLFRGFGGAYGTHGDTDRNLSKGGKLEIKKTARTIREPVTRELWERHVRGEQALGIIPICEDATCIWGCIDVDRYDMDLGAVVGELRRRRLPLVLCRTKSGGAHAFLFLSEPAPAEEIRVALRNMAASMGWGESEIFPKQNQVLVERNDLGSWLNMPYLGGNETDRYGVRENLTAYTLREFLDHAESMRTSLEEVPVAEATEELGDGPPCLQHLTSQGFPEGTRNNGLFALGIYAKKKYGENWRPELEEMNRRYMSPPLTSDEVMSVARSLEKKDYNYSCKEQPLCSHCESAICRGRKFGVGGRGLFPNISGLTKLDTDPPIWFVDIDDHRVELSTRELQNYREFQRICMEQITTYFMPMRNDTWAAIVGPAMQEAVILEASPDMSVRGYFMELVESFCRDRHRGERWEDIHQGRPFLDEETGRHFFRLKDLMAHLERDGFRHWGRNKIGQELSLIGGRDRRNIDRKFVNLFWVPDDIFSEPTPPVRLPRIVGSVI